MMGIACCLTFYTLTSVFIFSVLFPIHHKENLFKNPELLQLVIISFLIINFYKWSKGETNSSHQHFGKWMEKSVEKMHSVRLGCKGWNKLVEPLWSYHSLPWFDRNVQPEEMRYLFLSSGGYRAWKIVTRRKFHRIKNCYGC